jgi:hypothetical protein
MKKCLFYCVFILFISCVNDNKEISSLFPAQIEIKKIFHKELSTTSYSEYIIAGGIENVEISDYPHDVWKHQGWKVRRWDTIKTNSELKDIVSFLNQEISKYNYRNEYKDIVNRINNLIDSLESGSKNYIISYFYKDKPGEYRKLHASNDIYSGWLFFYSFDKKLKKMIRITNAYR